MSPSIYHTSFFFLSIDWLTYVGSHYVIQAVLEFTAIISLHPPQYWDCRRAPLNPKDSFLYFISLCEYASIAVYECDECVHVCTGPAYTGRDQIASGLTLSLSAFFSFVTNLTIGWQSSNPSSPFPHSAVLTGGNKPCLALFKCGFWDPNSGPCSCIASHIHGEISLVPIFSSWSS